MFARNLNAEEMAICYNDTFIEALGKPEKCFQPQKKRVMKNLLTMIQLILEIAPIPSKKEK